MPRVSTIPMKPGAANPASGIVEELLLHREEFAEIARKIVAESRAMYGKTQLSPYEAAEFKAHVARKLSVEKQRWMDLVQRSVLQVPPPAVIPPPPPAKELYGRIADGAEVVDVGSGNCFKLLADSGRLKITAVDPEVGEAHMTIKKVAREVEEADVVGKVITSCNALVQIPPGPVRDTILNEDGLHILPDHDELLKMGCAKEVGQKIHVQAPDAVYEDFPVPEPGYKISTGYKLLPCYKSRALAIGVSEDLTTWERGDYQPKINCSPCGPADIDWGDMGWKWDGVPMEIELQRGVAYVTRRDGLHATAPCDGPNMSLHVEWLRKQRLLVLLRVECYRNVVPPHSGEMLRRFCAKIRLKWGQNRLVPPPQVDLTVGPYIEGTLCPVDGVITRVAQKDYYIKPHWTVDLRQIDLHVLREKLRDGGKALEVDPQDGLWEYKVAKEDERYRLIPIRERDDKTTPTSLNTVDYLMGLPTLKELVAINGRAPEVEQLAGWFVDV